MTMTCNTFLVVLAACVSLQNTGFAQPPTPPIAPVEGAQVFPTCAQSYIGSSNSVHYYETAATDSMSCTTPFGTGLSNTLVSAYGNCVPCVEVTPAVRRNLFQFSSQPWPADDTWEVSDGPSAIIALDALVERLTSMLSSGRYLSTDESIVCEDSAGAAINKSRRQLAEILQQYAAAWSKEIGENIASYELFAAQFPEFYRRFGVAFVLVRAGGSGAANDPVQTALDLAVQTGSTNRVANLRRPINSRFAAQVDIDGATKYFYLHVGTSSRSSENLARPIVGQQTTRSGITPFRFRVVDRYAHSHVIEFSGGGTGPTDARSRKIIVTTHEDLGFGYPRIIFR